MCSREQSEREIAERLRAAADEAQLAVKCVEAEMVEAERQLDEGLILPDGSAPMKKRRQGPGRPPNSERPQASGAVSDGGDGGGDVPEKKGDKKSAKKAKASDGGAGDDEHIPTLRTA